MFMMLVYRDMHHQEGEIGVDIMSGRHSVDNQVKGPGSSLYALLVSGHDKVVSTNVPGSSLLVGRGGHCSHSVTHGLGELDPHLPQAADTNDANVETTLPGTKLGERGKHCDTSTENRACTGQGISTRNLYHKPRDKQFTLL